MLERDRLKWCIMSNAFLTARAAVLHLHVELGQRVAVEDRRIPHITLASRLDHVANLGQERVNTSARLQDANHSVVDPRPSTPWPAQPLGQAPGSKNIAPADVRICMAQPLR
jgi:hypothetical protein